VIARFFVDRPIFATVISLVIVLAGGVAVFTLPVALYPDVTPATVQVYAIYPGANATTVRDTVAAPIEEQVSGVEGMMYMSSRCTNDGTYTLNVTFKLGTDSDMAQVLVQNRVSLALPVVPALVQNEGITVKKMSPNTLMIVNLISPDGRYSDSYLSNYATIDVRDELGRLPGIAGVSYLGQRDYSLRAWLDPDKMAGLNISAMDVVNAISAQNIQVAAGMIGQRPVPSGQQFQLTVNTLGRLIEPDQFADIIIKGAGSSTGSSGSSGSSSSSSSSSSSNSTTGAGASVTTVPSTAVVRLKDICSGNKDTRFTLTARSLETLKDDNLPEHLLQKLDSLKDKSFSQADFIGQINRLMTADEKKQFQLIIVNNAKQTAGADANSGVERGSQQYDQSCTLDGRPSIALTIFQTPGSNAKETANGVYEKMKELKSRFPDGLDYQIVYDTTPFITESVNEVWYTLIDAVILVAIVVLLFLQDWRAMILPMIDVPVSLIGTFAVMSALGFTLNSLTLFGLVLAIGIVVDDAIVVLENIERQMATGLDARSATIKAMEEITGPVMAITLVLCAVFVPCCFLGGITGQFFKQFAVTITVSTFISAINALTMTPSRAVLIFKDDGKHKDKDHTHRREALPWWIFAVLGGIASYKYLPQFLGSHWLFPAVPPESEESSGTDWPALVRMVEFYAPPGILIGSLFGWFLIKPINAGLAWFFQLFNRAFDWTTDRYGAVVSHVLRIGVIVLIGYGGLLGMTYFQFLTTPTGFIPEQDKGYLILNVQLPDSASVERTESAMREVERIARETPGVKHTLSISGRSVILNANAPNLASMYVMLDNFDKRRSPDRTSTEIASAIQQRFRQAVNEAMKKRDSTNPSAGTGTEGEEARPAISEGSFNLIDARLATFGAPPVDGLGTTGGFNLILETRGSTDLDQLDRVAEQIVVEGNKTPGLQGLFTSAGANTPWLYLDIDRDKCRLLGVQVSDIFNTLEVYLGSYYVNNFNEFGRTWQVNIQADPKFRSKTSDILQLQVRNSQNQMVRMGTMMSVRDTSGPVVVMRYNLYSAASITGNPAPGTGSGDAIRIMEEMSQKQLGIGMKLEWTELAYLQNQAGNSAMFFFLLAVVFVFLVLAAQYESWKLPMAVILVVPMCLLCSIIGVQVAGIEVTVFTQIGFVVLVGLACKNAILIVEFAKQKQEEGKSRNEATIEAARLRLRPIVMTSFAFIFGVLPLVYAQGAGSEMRRSLGVAVFAGMLGVTAFGIFLTPVFYSVIQWLGANPAPGASPKPEGELPSDDPDPHGKVSLNGTGHTTGVESLHEPVHTNGAALQPQTVEKTIVVHD
jgi:multidrug efflux pump subunit AcrB